MGAMMRNEHPIIMADPASVPAILAGRKTQTRRLVNLDRLSVFVPRDVPCEVSAFFANESPSLPRTVLKRGRHRARLNPQGAVIALLPDGGVGAGLKPGEFDFACPHIRGQTTLSGNEWVITPSSRQYLRVREDFRIVHEGGGAAGGDLIAANIPKDSADGYWKAQYRSDPGHNSSRWHRATYMPTWAVRLRPEVLLVRLQRLHALTDSDAQAEGVQPFFERFPMFGRDQRITSGELAREAPYRASYAVSWDTINGSRALWVTNPWVWAITMGTIKGR
jgi:hypothetical protein